MQRLLTFVVPLRAPAASKNWERVLERLLKTMRSIEAACANTPGLGAVLVANHGAELPELPGCFDLVRVDLAPPAVSVFFGDGDDDERRNAVWWDKGFKVATGMRHALSLGTRFVMSVDADDLISRRIGSLPLNSPDSNGWFINNGWLLTAGSRWSLAIDDFHNWCGTYAIVRADLLPLIEPIEALDPEEIRLVFGHHRNLIPLLAERGTPLEEAGFRAAIYIVGHSESNYRRGRLRSEQLALHKIFSNPRNFLRWLRRLRYLGYRSRSEFSL